MCVGGGIHGIQQRGVLSWILQWVSFKLVVLCHSLFQRLVSFVKQKKKKTKIDNYRSRIGKVHGSEITFNAIMCLLAIIFYGFVLPKAQFTMVLLKISSHLGT